MIFRRLPASSSFVLAAARLRALQLDPGRATRRPGTCEEDPEEQSAQPGRQDVATGPDPYALLTVVALMGADERRSLHEPVAYNSAPVSDVGSRR